MKTLAVVTLLAALLAASRAAPYSNFNSRSVSRKAGNPLPTFNLSSDL